MSDDTIEAYSNGRETASSAFQTAPAKKVKAWDNRLPVIESSDFGGKYVG